jgi:hypothetical protein
LTKKDFQKAAIKEQSMKTWQRISLILIALALCLGLLSFSLPATFRFDRMAWSGGVVTPDVSWNSRIVWTGGESQPDVSWNSRIAWFGGIVTPDVSWNS